jgi:hypothetical protein
MHLPVPVAPCQRAHRRAADARRLTPPCRRPPQAKVHEGFDSLRKLLEAQAENQQLLDTQLQQKEEEVRTRHALAGGPSRSLGQRGQRVPGSVAGLAGPLGPCPPTPRFQPTD